MMSQGWMPAGLSMAPDTVFILYSDDPALKASRFSLSPSKTRDAMTADIKAMQAKGFSVAGIHYAASAKAWFVLYTDMAASMQDSRLVESSLDARDVTSAVSPYLNKGYLPVGVTTAQGRCYTLMARLKGLEPKSWMLDFSKPGGVNQALDKGVAAGYSPFGLHVSDGGCNLLFVTYSNTSGRAAAPQAAAQAKQGKPPARDGARAGEDPDPSAPLSEERMRSIMNEFMAQ